MVTKHRIGPAMDVAAIIIAIIALLVSFWAAWSSHRSAKAAQTTADIDLDRRHEERAPNLEIGHVPKLGTPDGGTIEGFTINNRGPFEYEQVTLTLVSPQHGPVKGLQVPGTDVEPMSESVAFGPLPLGEGKLVLCEDHEPRRAGPVRLRATCIAAGEQWEQLLELRWPSKRAKFL